jgi:hypothetical protein
VPGFEGKGNAVKNETWVSLTNAIQRKDSHSSLTPL